MQSQQNFWKKKKWMWSERRKGPGYLQQKDGIAMNCHGEDLDRIDFGDL